MESESIVQLESNVENLHNCRCSPQAICSDDMHTGIPTVPVSIIMEIAMLLMIQRRRRFSTLLSSFSLCVYGVLLRLLVWSGLAWPHNSHTHAHARRTTCCAMRKRYKVQRSICVCVCGARSLIYPADSSSSSSSSLLCASQLACRRTCLYVSLRVYVHTFACVRTSHTLEQLQK